MIPRLKDIYDKSIIPNLNKNYHIKINIKYQKC